MCRIARVVFPGSPHHITQRGIRRFDIFRDDEDRNFYLKLFAESSRRFGLRVCAYCLMTNHVHFVAIPERKDSIWKTFHRCHGVYAVRFNIKYALAGHLFQGRPFSSVLDERHFWAAIRYVERNPVRAAIVERAEEYAWSSAIAHCRRTPDRLLDPTWTTTDEIDNWAEWLRGEEADESLRRIRTNTFTGRPCGDDHFVRHIEKATGREFQRRKPGPKSASITVEPSPSLWTVDDVCS